MIGIEQKTNIRMGDAISFKEAGELEVGDEILSYDGTNFISDTIIYIYI